MYDTLHWLGQAYGAYRAAQDSGIWMLEEQLRYYMDALAGIIDATPRSK